jgi:hypothetical protein
LSIHVNLLNDLWVCFPFQSRRIGEPYTPPVSFRREGGVSIFLNDCLRRTTTVILKAGDDLIDFIRIANDRDDGHPAAAFWAREYIDLIPRVREE